MHPNTRACVAYVAGRLISKKNASSVYDYSMSKHISIDGNLSDSKVDVFDFERGCHFGGSGSLSNLSLYDYGGQHHVELKIKGRKFEGYDYGSGCQFSGDVNGSSISLYDYGESSHFDFSF